MKISKFKFTQILQRSMFAEIMQIVLTHVVSPLPPDCLRLFNGGNNERGYLSYLPFQLNHAAVNSQSSQAKPCLFWFTFHLRRHMAAVTASSIKCQHQSETSMQLKFPRASFDSFAPFRGDVYDAHTFNLNVNYPARPQAALTWIPSP